MKRTILLFLVLATTKCISQIYFAPNANMYVKGVLLYVEQNINLDANSNLYLRNNSQLIQGTTSFSGNSGLGTLSVYQEGTTDNFDYNYWCSPIGNATALTGNESFGITMLNRPTSPTISTPALILPTGILDGVSNPLSIASRWIYKLVNANNYSQWVFVGGTTAIAPGEGFTMKGTSGTDATDPEGTGLVNNPGSAQRYDFRGKPNDGTIIITLGANNATLTGNPYPSALHLNAFLLDPDNTATGGIAYFWEQDKTVNSHFLTDYRGGYGTYSPIAVNSGGLYAAAAFSSYKADGSLNTTGLSSGLSIQRKFAAIGQGFILNGTVNGTAIFKNSHRLFYREGSGLSQFEKHKAQIKKIEKNASAVTDVSHFKLNTIINNQFTRQLALAFLPEATDNVDIGIDALDMNGDLPNDVTFLLNNDNYVIQGIAFDQTKKIPLTVKAAVASTFKFYVPEVINFDSSQPIYLYDTLDQSYHDIKNGTYQVIVAPGVYSDRFKIAFANQTLGMPSENKEQFIIRQDNSHANLNVSNPNNLTIKSFKLYDMSGKLVLYKKAIGSDLNYVFSTNGLSYGAYIAEFLTVDNERFTQKVLISYSSK
ncbi:putative secreted protein (Por secretion system target) [Flavobacterium araucananum]|uniref:Secretion protein n=1 Tax=Flavobacterium araucananum TaxID=946678 RepID=A0A227P567_9FLAO|nr:T9SS type A sorting domain-containing protein [Flavobacterium araucananum]OXG05049.1 secretion protein [Flavobacterium araucananum]PWJ96762.1 putative secreted protein (Por secretion system target) [Flavobacterium araucananum]